MDHYEVVIVGAGPAGCSAALTAACSMEPLAQAHEGAGSGRVLLLEKQPEIGLPVQCAEYVPVQLRRCVPWSPEVVGQEIRVMRTHLPDGEVVETAAAGYVIHRDRFDQGLAAAARRAGAEIRVDTRALELTDEGLLGRQGRREFEIGAQIIVGADGPHSTVRTWMEALDGEGVSAASDPPGLTVTQSEPSGARSSSHIRPQGVRETFGGDLMMGAAQCRVHLRRPVEATQIYFDPLYVGGYGWVFPKGEVANVGVGVCSAGPGPTPVEALDHLLDRVEIRPSDVIGHSGGTIPCGGPPPHTCGARIILVGDAAGQTHPITGGGVANACLCGQMAGRAAASAAVCGSPDPLEQYEREWRGYLGGVLAHAVTKRRMLSRGWTQNAIALSALVRQTWVAFPDYGRRTGSSRL